MEKELVKPQEIKEDNKFLGTEKIGKLLVKFAIPCVISLVIQSLYNIVDQIFIGNCATLGQLGNTATGVVYPLTVIALAVALLLGDGSSACMSLNQGRNNTKDTHRSIGTSFTTGLIISLLFMGICFIFKDPILLAFGATPEVFPYASEYANWIIVGFPFYIMSTIMNPIIRADGSPKYAMISMIVGAVTNIILDPIFIFTLNMGMTGAALATCIAQIVSFVISFIYFFRTKSFKFVLKSFLIDFKLLWLNMKLGVSSFLAQIAIVIIAVVNNNILSIYVPYDTSAIGLLNIAFKVFGIIISVIIGICAGGQPIIGYNYGAKKFDRVKQAFKYLIITATIVGIIATIMFEAMPSLIMKMFGYASVSEFGLNTFRIYLSLILLTCLGKTVSIFFQAIGKPVKSALLSLCRDLIFVVPLAIIFPMIGGIDLFLWSAPVADVLTIIVAIIFVVGFFKDINKQQKEMGVANEESVKIAESKKGVIIAISRQHGAGGREIGQKLAEKLGIPFYDKEVCSLAAKESGLSSEYIENMEEQTAMYNLYLSADVNKTAMMAQSQILKQIAEKGACVIVGRAADHVLAEYNICKVFIQADDEYRIARIMKNYGDNREEAIVNMKKSDKKRASFYEAITGKEWGNAANYDLAIDSSIGVDKAVEIIESYYNGLQDKK